MNLTLEQRRAIRGWARREPMVKEVWLFGSVAKGTDHDKSDVDIAVRFNTSDEEVGPLFFMLGEGWQSELRTLTGLPIALAHLAGDKITPKHETAIRDHGIRLYPQRYRDLL